MRKRKYFSINPEPLTLELVRDCLLRYKQEFGHFPTELHCSPHQISKVHRYICSTCSQLVLLVYGTEVNLCVKVCADGQLFPNEIEFVDKDLKHRYVVRGLCTMNGDLPI